MLQIHVVDMQIVPGNSRINCDVKSLFGGITVLGDVYEEFAVTT